MSAEWKEDVSLERDLKQYISKNLRRDEVLDFVSRDYSQYSWSLSTLDRRLRYFDNHYINYDIPVEAVQTAVRQELQGPGNLLGYQAMNLELRTLHDIQAPRNLVHKVMQNEDPDGLAGRSLERKKSLAKHHSCVMEPLMFFHLMDMTSYAATKIGPSRWEFMDVLTHFHERLCLYMFASQIQTL